MVCWRRQYVSVEGAGQTRRCGYGKAGRGGGAEAAWWVGRAGGRTGSVRTPTHLHPMRKSCLDLKVKFAVILLSVYAASRVPCVRWAASVDTPCFVLLVMAMRGGDAGYKL